jgi:hypothetical protein
LSAHGLGPCVSPPATGTVATARGKRRTPAQPGSSGPGKPLEPRVRGRVRFVLPRKGVPTKPVSYQSSDAVRLSFSALGGSLGSLGPRGTASAPVAGRVAVSRVPTVSARRRAPVKPSLQPAAAVDPYAERKREHARAERHAPILRLQGAFHESRAGARASESECRGSVSLANATTA